jgi:hypothetical protein
VSQSNSRIHNPARSGSEGIRDDALTPSDAYALMADLGVSYSSTARDIHRAGIDAQATRRLDRARAKAWADLRNVEKRLALDITFAEVSSRDGAREAGIPVEFEPLPAPSIEALAAALPVPAVSSGPTPNPDLPLPAVDVFELAAELVEAEEPPAFVYAEPPPFLSDDEESNR